MFVENDKVMESKHWIFEIGENTSELFENIIFFEKKLYFKKDSEI